MGRRDMAEGRGAGRMGRTAFRIVRGLVGAALGGGLGYYVTVWLADHGMYALVVPGGLLGAGCGLISGTRSRARGIACGVAGLSLGVFTDWKVAPFLKDGSFVYFLTHFHQGNAMFILMVLLGALAGYWFGKDYMPGVYEEKTTASQAERFPPAA
jgi:hypothetical protein